MMKNGMTGQAGATILCLKVISLLFSAFSAPSALNPEAEDATKRDLRRQDQVIRVDDLIVGLFAQDGGELRGPQALNLIHIL